ncbi:MAG TPA: hypothetical protein VGS79_08415 [Puia sp.]|nr:hypothetical protein [Puia sp.]
MIAENSGKIFRFTMDHGLGYGFSEVYDFTDESMFDGRYGFAYNRRDVNVLAKYNIDEIRSSGIALGPITFYKFPNVKGIGAWKYLYQTNDFKISERPMSKSLQGMHNRNDNWAEMKEWFRWPYDLKKERIFVPYEEVRYLETRILNGPGSLVKKFTMKTLLDMGKKVSEYYDMKELGNRNLYVQLINTYYSIDQTKEFLKDLPKNGKSA